MERFAPTKIYIETGLEEASMAVAARQLAPGAVVEGFEDLPRLLERLGALAHEEAKRRLVLARRKGGFVKEFPSGPGIAGNSWRYFVPAIGCPADCRYCFLQTYHSSGVPVVFAETGSILAEIEAVSAEIRGGYFYGGELCDNLLLEGYLEIAGPLVGLFRRLPKAFLELRTKGLAVEPLLAAGPAPNVIVSWTFSPEETVRLYEPGTAPVSSRIAAAAELQRAGFKIGVRLDPVILTDGWEDSYRRLIKAMSAALDPASIESVHIGCLRFTPELKRAVDGRFGRGEPFCAEFVLGPDGKYRYPRPVRASAYAKIKRMLSEWDGALRCSLCMETPAVTADLERILKA